MRAFSLRRLAYLRTLVPEPFYREREIYYVDPNAPKTGVQPDGSSDFPFRSEDEANRVVGDVVRNVRIVRLA